MLALCVLCNAQHVCLQGVPVQMCCAQDVMLGGVSVVQWLLMLCNFQCVVFVQCCGGVVTQAENRCDY